MPIFVKPLLTINPSNDIKLSKAQSTKMQKGGFSRFLAPLLKSGLPLLKSAIKPLGVLGSGTTTLIISNDEMNDILKIVKSLEDSGVLLKGVNETIKNEAKEQKGGFLNMLLGTLGASLLGNMLEDKRVIRAGEGEIRAGYGSKRSSLKKC